MESGGGRRVSVRVRAVVYVWRCVCVCVCMFVCEGMNEGVHRWSQGEGGAHAWSCARVCGGGRCMCVCVFVCACACACVRASSPLSSPT